MSESTNQLIHDISAQLFWMLSEQIGFSNTIQEVENTAGQCLLNQSFTISVLEQHGLMNFSREDILKLLSAIAQEANQYVAREANMLGIVYAEDSQVGRSPSARKINTESLNIIPRRILTNQNIEVAGSLCLRHPLPAVIFSSFVPDGNLILVDNTTTALGFNLPILFTIAGLQPFHEALYALSGTFYIPAPNEQIGERWNSVIQNSTRFFSELRIQDGSQIIEIDVEW